MEDLVGVLARERAALERLLFRLVEARDLLGRPDGRFLHLAANDVEDAAHDVRELELFRALADPEVEGTALRELAATAAPPLDVIFEDHRRALGRLAAEIGATIEATAELAAEGRARVRAQDLVPEAADELDHEVLAAGYDAVLGASLGVQLPSLVALLA
jgi:hypothetical protein